MKVFKLFADDLFWGYSGKDQEEAKAQLFDDVGEMEIDKIEEVPESEWDDESISIWEDNDLSKEPFQTSIREQMNGDYPQQLFTNDVSSF